MARQEPVGRARRPGATGRHPRRTARSDSSISSRHSSGSASTWTRAKVTGRRMAADRRRIQSTSCFGRPGCPRRPSRPGPARRCRCPARRGRLPMPNSSSSAAKVPGTGSPSMARWAMVRDVENPSAPAAIASFTMCLHGGDVLRRRRLVAGPALAHHVGPHRAVGDLGARRRPSTAGVSRASRYSGKVSHSQVIPSESAVPGMSSTPSMRPISHSWRSGRAGANPTPQLPGHQRGDPVPAARGEHVVPGGLAVVVGVDVDPARASPAGRRRRRSGRPPRPGGRPRR